MYQLLNELFQGAKLQQESKKKTDTLIKTPLFFEYGDFLKAPFHS